MNRLLIITMITLLSSFTFAATTATNTNINTENVISTDDFETSDIQPTDYDVEAALGMQSQTSVSGNSPMFGAAFYFRPGTQHRAGFRVYLPTSEDSGKNSYMAEASYRFLFRETPNTLFFQTDLGINRYNNGENAHLGLGLGAVHTLADEISIGGTAGLYQIFGNSTDLIPRISAFIAMEI